MSWIENRVFNFDSETTGPDPKEARLVTWAAGIVNPDGRALMAHEIVNPGVEIPEEAANVHGITTERAEAEGQSPIAALERLSNAFHAANLERAPVVIFNARYDLTVIWHELQRHGRPELWVPFGNAYILDPLVIDKAMHKYRKGSRRLQAMCEFYGVTLEDWHSADADAVAGARLMYAIAKAYPHLGSANIAELHEKQRSWAADQAISLQTYLRDKKGERDAVVEQRWPYAPAA